MLLDDVVNVDELLPHSDMRIISHQLLRKNLHVDVCVVELFPHLPQLTHSIVQVPFTLAPAARQAKPTHTRT